MKFHRNTGQSDRVLHFVKLQHVQSVCGVCGFHIHIEMWNLGLRDFKSEGISSKARIQVQITPLHVQFDFHALWPG